MMSSRLTEAAKRLSFILRLTELPLVSDRLLEGLTKLTAVGLHMFIHYLENRGSLHEVASKEGFLRYLQSQANYESVVGSFSTSGRGAHLRAVVMNPVCPTIRWDGRMLRPPTDQGRIITSMVSMRWKVR